MDSAYLAPSLLTVMIAGGPESGKTTFLRALAPGPVDAAGAGAGAPESGRVTLGGRLALQLTVLPAGAGRWRQDDIALGCAGAVVLADPRSPEACGPAARTCERAGLRYVVALSPAEAGFRMEPRHEELVRDAAWIQDRVPVVVCDARDRRSAAFVLLWLLAHIVRARGRPSLPPRDGSAVDLRPGIAGLRAAGAGAW